MASVKISNLPQIYTYDNAAYLVTVDSGATQTSKIEVVDLMRASGQTLISDTSLIIASNGYAGGSQINSGDYNAIIGGDGAIITNNTSKSVVLGTQRAAGGQTPTIDGSSHSLIGAAFRNTKIYGGSERSAIIADEDSQINQGYTSFIAGSAGTTLGTFLGGINKVVSLGSASGNIEQATEVAVISTRNFTAHFQGSNTGAMIASKSPTIEPVSNSAEVMSIINSKSSTLRPNQHNSLIMNSDSVSIDDSTGSNTQISAIINGWGGGINGNSLGSNYQKMLINTYGTQITHGGSRVMAINANGGTISATGDHNMLLNTESIDITGSVNKVTKIGVWDTNHTTQHENTTHTDNLHTYNTESFDVIAGGNVTGTINVDCSLGTIFTFTLIGNTTPNFTNVRTGQRFIFIIYNNGSWAVPTATVNGVGGTVYAKNGTISPSNNGYSKYTATYDGSNMFLDEELNFSAV